MPKKVDKRKILELHDGGKGLSIHAIHDVLGNSRNTIKAVIDTAAAAGLTSEALAETSKEEIDKLLYTKKNSDGGHPPLNFEYIKKELELTGVNRKLLWSEHCQQCAEDNTLPYQYSQYCKLYAGWSETKALTRRLPHTPGYSCELDWVGDQAKIIDFVTGEIIGVWVFAATMGYSGRMYVEAFHDMKQQSWIAANIHALRFFGGAPKICIPDNLKSGVKKPDYFEPEINSTFSEMARFYGMTIIPAQVAKPKQKPKVERAVQIVETWIIAYLRNRNFFTLAELNEAIFERTDTLNAQVLADRDVSRDELFFSDEQHLLKKLPATDFEMATWKTAKLAQDVHFQLERMRYSAPYTHVGKVLDLRITATLVEVFFDKELLCTHKRLWGRIGQYSTVDGHMPPHLQDGEHTWSAEGFQKWAANIGPFTARVVSAIIESKPIVEQAYRSCRGILSLAKKKGSSVIERACEQALSNTQHPSYTQIKNISEAIESTPATRAKNDDLAKGRLGDTGYIRDPKSYRDRRLGDGN
jgi:transposase